MKQIKKRSLWISIPTAIFLVFLLASCGARKSEVKIQDTKIDLTEKTKEAVTETSEKQAETNVKTETTKTLDTKTNVVTEVIKVTPIDATKPSSYKNEKGVVIDLTNSIYEKQIKTDLSNAKEQSYIVVVMYKKELEKALKQSKKDKEKILALEQKLKDKNVDKKASYWWLWLLLLIPIGYYGYKLYKKYPLNL